MEIAMKKLVVLTALLAVGLFTASGADARENRGNSIKVHISGGIGNVNHNRNNNGVISGGIGNSNVVNNVVSR
jgi:hypothetical protein